MWTVDAPVCMHAQTSRSQSWCGPYPVLAAMEGMGMPPDHGCRRLDTSANTLRRCDASFGGFETADFRMRACLAPAWAQTVIRL